jgi:hypothetical protein
MKYTGKKGNGMARMLLAILSYLAITKGVEWASTDVQGEQDGRGQPR